MCAFIDVQNNIEIMMCVCNDKEPRRDNALCAKIIKHVIDE